MTDEVKPVVWMPDGVPAADALQLAATDTVKVALRPLSPGDRVGTLTVRDRIPKGHKLACHSMAAGQRVLKYGQTIGVASVPIPAGAHVHSHNLEYRENDADYRIGVDHQPLGVAGVDTFEGYRRSDGRVGTRNYIAVISSVNCSATAAQCMAAAFDQQRLADHPGIDGVVAFTHGTGCGMAGSGDGFDNLQRVLAGYARHPCVGGVLFVGLGCEMSQIHSLLDTQSLQRGPLLRTLNIQGGGGHKRSIARGVAILEDMLDTVGACRRQCCPVSSLVLALQCGGSDAWSGITANPALGHAADLLVRQGGTAVLAETPEIYGAEHLLLRRAASESVGAALVERVHWWQDYVARNHGSLDNNPSPGNKLGGLTTILEKSLGAVIKGGSTSLQSVVRYAQPIDSTGLVFMDSPGYDPASVTGEIAGGCNLVAFTTGRGSTFGSKPAPCLKIATNTDMFRQLEDDMDIDAGTIVSAGDAVADVGERIFRRLLSLASGEPSCSERDGLGDNEFVPWQIGATL